MHTTSGNLEYAQAGEGVPAVILINGSSDKPSNPQHGIAIVNSLRQLLSEVNLHPPYILVGHSLGGLYANLFARQYPDEIAGVVLLDSSHPQELKINETQNAFIRGINRILRKFDSSSTHGKWNEVHFVEETVKQIEQAGPFPDVPLFVVSGGKKPPMLPEHAYQLRKDNQQDFLH